MFIYGCQWCGTDEHRGRNRGSRVKAMWPLRSTWTLCLSADDHNSHVDLMTKIQKKRDILILGATSISISTRENDFSVIMFVFRAEIALKSF
jgi:hypothetical protein